VKYGVAAAFALILGASFGGCSIPALLHVFNNSGATIVVHVRDTTYTSGSGAEVAFEDRPDVAFEIGGVTVRYPEIAVGPEYIRTGLTRAHITFQVERDRRMFVLKAGDQPPIDPALYPQPAGYPLVPIAQ